MVSPELLRRTPFFLAGGEEALEAVAMMSEEVHAPRGTVLFEEGDPADRLYVVLGGEVDVVQPMGEAGEVVVDSVIAGELLGWSAMTDHRRRRSKAVAARDSRLVAVDAAALHELCEDEPRLAARLYRAVVETMARRLTGAWVQVAAHRA